MYFTFSLCFRFSIKFIFGILPLIIIFSCTRSLPENPEIEVQPNIPAAVIEVRPAARPSAILQPGKYPIWFQLTEKGPVHISSIEDAIYSAAFIPWPFAYHVIFSIDWNGNLVILINRDGFMKFTQDGSSRIVMYHFSGGEYWKQYSAGGLAVHDDKPVALLYFDDRFLDSSAAVPLIRTWTFDMKSNIPFPLEIGVLKPFPAEEGWNVDTLRKASDGFWYFRAVKKTGSPEIQLRRTADLSQAGEPVSLGVFQNSAPRRQNISYSSLPDLPEGFFYTGTTFIGDNLFAFWEEQQDYSIGAAGFLVVKQE